MGVSHKVGQNLSGTVQCVVGTESFWYSAVRIVMELRHKVG